MAINFIVRTINGRSELDLSNQNLTVADIPAVINYLNDNAHITALNLSGNRLRDAGVLPVIANCPRITVLNISFNHVTNDGARALADKNITELDLTENSISDEGAICLATNPYIQKLMLGSNLIRDAGAEALAANNTLLHLGLKENSITVAGIQTFLQNTTLEELDIRDNEYVPLPLTLQIAEHIKKNKENKIWQPTLQRHALQNEEARHASCAFIALGAEDPVTNKVRHPKTQPGRLPLELKCAILEFFFSPPVVQHSMAIDISCPTSRP